MYITGLPDLLIEPIVRDALKEDLGLAGDVTASAVIAPKSRFKAEFRAREAGITAGIDCARLALSLMDPQVRSRPCSPMAVT